MSQPVNSHGAENPPNGSSDHEKKGAVSKAPLIRKGLLITVAAFALLLLLVSLLLFTHTGNALLWRQLAHSLDALNGELTDGQLITGWRLKNLQWHDPQISFQAEEVTLKWQLGKLFTKQLPVELIEVRQGHLEIQPTDGETTPKEASTTDSTMTIPLDILIHQINIQNFTFNIAGTNASLESFVAKARLVDNQLSISEILADNLQVQVDPQKGPSANKKPPAHEKQSAPVEFDLSTITLPEIKLPIPIKLEQFTLTNAHYQQGEIDETLNRLVLSFDWQSSTIKNLQLKLNQTRANALLTGDIQLSENYPLAIDLDATLLDNFNIPQLTAIKGERFSLKASGDLSRLQLQLSTQGAVNASLQGSIGPLTPKMPLDLTLEWPRLSWPLSTETPQIMADSGSVRLTGHLNQYQLSLDTLLTLAEQPTVNVTLQSSGNLEQLNIAEFSISPVDPKNIEKASAKPLKLQGKVNWSNGIHWQGQINLAQLKPDMWLPDIPGILDGTLDGKIDTQFSINAGQWQMSIPELNVTGSLRNNPLEITGKLEANNQVGAMAVLPVTVIVEKLSASLGENHLNINGQIAEQLSLKTRLNAKALDTLHPDLKGTLQGDIQLSGSDEHPKLSFSLASPSVTFQQTNIDQLQASGVLTKTTLLEGNATIDVNSLSSGSLQLKQLAFSAEGNERNHQLSLKHWVNPYQESFWSTAPGKALLRTEGSMARAISQCSHCHACG